MRARGGGLQRTRPPEATSHAGDADGLDYEFFPVPSAPRGDLDEAHLEGALVEIGAASSGRPSALRRTLPARPVGSVSLRWDAAALKRSRELGFDFHLASWRTGDPHAREVLAHFEDAARPRGSGAARRRHPGPPAHDHAPRSAILTDIVKTANSILEPRKVIELIMAKIQQLIPSEAWSMLMVDEEKQELTFELALGEKGKDVSVFRVKIGEGIAGWVAQTGEPTIVNDTSKRPALRAPVRRHDPVPDRARSSARPSSRAGAPSASCEVINKQGGKLHPGRPRAAAHPGRALRHRHRERDPVPAHGAAHHHRRPHHALQLALPEPLHRARDQALQAPRHPALRHLPRPRRLQGRQRRSTGTWPDPRTLDRGRAASWCEAVRESDILARYGGDEFVVVLPETPPSGALVIAERIRTRHREPRAS